MNNHQPLNLLAAFGLGAGLSYIADPHRARRRQAYARDQLDHLARQSTHMLEVGGRDFANRSRGVFAVARSMLRRERDLSDDVIEDRVRSKLGRVVSHPHAIDVYSDDGDVTLRGLVLDHEFEALLSCVSAVRGVKSISNELKVHKPSDNIAALQGGRNRLGHHVDFMQSNWSPSTRLLVGAGGAALGAVALFRRDAIGAVIGGASLLALVRSISNMDTKRLFGIGAGRRAVSVHKTIHIQAPIEQVFKFWTRFENFPKFMKEVKSVRVSKDRKASHWTVQGPLGAPVSWDAEVTRTVDNKLLAWRSVDGAAIQNAGQIKFLPSEHGGTKLEIDFSYNPPGGAVGHSLVKLFGADPKRRIEWCVAAMKQLIEQGPSPRQARALG